MKLTPDPFNADAYPERGVLYVRTDDGGILRFNVSVGVEMFDADDVSRLTFTGTTIGHHKVVRHPSEA